MQRVTRPIRLAAPVLWIGTIALIMRALSTSALAAILILGAARASGAGPLPGSPAAHEAMALCDAAAREPDGRARLSLLERSLALAEAVVRRDERDAAGHFAVFCALGRRLQEHALGWRTLGAISRLRRAIDRALALAPDAPELLTAKGMMLLKLPRLFGGDVRAGEQLLRRVLELHPAFPEAVQALADRTESRSSSASGRP